MICFYCLKEIPLNMQTQITFDVPYINLYVHKECSKLIYEYGVNKYIQDNKARFLELAEKNAVEFGMPTRKVKRKC